MTNIRDVAALAGVSSTTVSHIINNTRFVSEETRKKVLEAIDELGYYPSKLAQGLANNNSRTIGVVFSDITNPHFTQIFKGIEYVFQNLGYDLLVSNTSENPDNQEQALKSLLAGSVNGLILALTGFPSERLPLIKKKGLPVVLVDRNEPQIGFPFVGVNNEKGAYEAVRHLFSDGHTRLGLILGLRHTTTTEERFNGFDKAHKEMGIPYNPNHVYWGDYGIEAGYRGVVELLKSDPRPTAIFCANNLMTLGALHAIRDLGLNCPEDIGLMGFDDHLWADIFNPPLTVVSQPTFEMGVKAAQILYKQIVEGVSEGIPNRINFETKLIIRGSCSPTCRQQYSKNGGV